MSYYHTCPYCETNLGPGERCDRRGNEKALASAANTGEGKANKALTRPDSTFNINENGGFDK